MVPKAAAATFRDLAAAERRFGAVVERSGGALRGRSGGRIVLDRESASAGERLAAAAELLDRLEGR